MTDEQRTKAIAYFKNRSQTALMPGANAMFRLALEALEQLKIDPVKHGHWAPVPSSDMATGKAYLCSTCKKMRYGAYLPTYCPNCGARMDGEV